MKRRLRISVYPDEKIEAFLPLFSESVNKKSLLGEFLKKVIIFINETTDDPKKTTEIIRQVAKGNTEILKSIFSETLENVSIDNSSALNEDFDSGEEVAIDDFIL